MSHKIAIIEEYNRGLPVGSVLQDAVIVKDFEGNEYWEGMHYCPGGSYMETVPLRYCEIWDEEKHDPMYVLKKYLAQKNEIRVESEERATLKRLKAKYEGE
jgi:hypothetical protein